MSSGVFVIVCVAAAVLTEKTVTLHTAGWSGAVSSFDFHLIYTTAGVMQTRQRPRKRQGINPD